MRGTSIRWGLGRCRWRGGGSVVAGVPNPFNPRTAIGFTLAQGARVALAVYDVRGRLVRRVLDAQVEAGAHPRLATWDGLDDQGRVAPSGTYFLRLTTDGGFSDARKMTLLR